MRVGLGRGVGDGDVGDAASAGKTRMDATPEREKKARMWRWQWSMDNIASMASVAYQYCVSEDDCYGYCTRRVYGDVVLNGGSAEM